MKKCLSLLIALTMVLSVCVLPVSADVANGYIFNETFEGYADGNWVNYVDGGYVTIDGAQKNAWTVAGTYNDGGIIQVVDGKTVTGDANFTGGKVLEVNAGTSANWMAIKRNALNADGTYKVNRQVGKNLVYEAMVFVPTDFNAPQETAFLNMATEDKPGNYKGRSSVFAHLSKTSWIPRSSGQYNSTYYARYTVSDSYEQEKTRGEWKHVRYVVNSAQDVANKDESDTSRFYLDDVVFTSEYTHDPNANAAAAGKNAAFPYEIGDKIVDFHGGDLNTNSTTIVNGFPYRGTTFVVYNPTGQTNISRFFIDDLKAYFVDEFAMGTPVNTENYAAGSKIEVPFTSEVKDAFTERFYAATASGTTASKYHTLKRVLANDLIKLTDASGVEIEGGIASATLKAGDSKVVEIVLNSDAVEGNADYKLQFAVEFRDVYGQGLNDHNRVETISVHTAEALDVLEAPESIDGLIPNDPRTVEVEVSGTIASVEADLNGAALETLYNGATATISFANVAEPKSGVVNVKITSDDGQEIALEIPATAVSSDIEYIINDNLEGFALGNLITDATGKKFVNGNLRFNTAADSLAAAGTAEIVKDDVQGNVLKFATTGQNLLSVNYAGDQSDAMGKVLVLRAKYYIPSDFTNTSKDGNKGAAISVPSSLDLAANPSTPNFRLRSGGNISINSGNYSYNRQEQNFKVNVDNWTDIVAVLDYATEGTLTDPHTTRRYYDGKINVITEAMDTKHPTDGAVKHTMYDTAPAGYRGHWDFSGLASGYTEDNAVAHKFSTTKMNGIYTMFGNVATDADNKGNVLGPKEAWLMMDDFQAFYADKFKVTSISANKDAFIPNRHTLKVVFNQPIDQTQADSVKLYNAAGAEVKDLVAKVANGGYAIDFTLPLVDAGAYKLAFSPEFHDIQSFQGLGSKNKDYEIPVTVTEYVAFKAEVDNAAITGFVQGKTTKAVVTLSAKTALVDSNAAEAFDVVNAKGETVEGLVADVADDQMSITLDFTKLPTDNYTITSNDKLVDKDGFALEGAAVKITIAARIDKIMIFEEDFDGNGTGTSDYDLGVNWLETTPSNGKWTVATPSSYKTDNDKMSVENTAIEGMVNAGISGNYLHLFNEQFSTTDSCSKEFGAKALVNVDMDQYPGKVLVMEVDMFGTSIGDGSNPLIASFDSNTIPASTSRYYKHNGGSFVHEGGWFSKGNKTHYANFWHGGWTDSVKTTDAKVVTVIDQRNEMDTVKMIINGENFNAKSNTLLTDHPLYQSTLYEIPLKYNSGTETNYFSTYDAGDLTGVTVMSKTSKASTIKNTDMCIDNIKVYLVDAFEITGIDGVSTAFNVAKDTIKFNFTNKVKSVEDAMDNIKITDAEGADVAYTASTAEGGYQLVIDIDDQASGELKITVSPEIQDEFGQPLAHKYYDYQYTFTGTGTGYLVVANKVYTIHNTKEAAEAVAGGTVYPYTWKADGNGNITASTEPVSGAETPFTWVANGWVRDEKAMKLVTVIKTTKSTSLYAEATKAVVDGMNVSTTLKFTNPEEETLPVWYIVAAYGDYNEMIGCKSASLVVAKGSTDDIPVTFKTTSSDIKAIKVYVWDTYKTMIPYQAAEDIK